MVGKLRCSCWVLLMAAFLFTVFPNNVQALEQSAAANIRPPFLDKLIEYVDKNNPQEEEVEPEEEEDLVEIIFHRVQSGETVDSIADRYKSSGEVIALNNHLNTSTQIQEGEVLRITRGYMIIHEVAQGDTIWDIASEYSIGRNELLDVNNVDNPEQLQIGETLIIPADKTSLEKVAAENDAQATIAARSASTLTLSRQSPSSPQFIWPADGWISSHFGPRSGGYHFGLDIAVPTGTPLLAIASGNVEYSGWRGGYGRAVILDHGDGWRSLYGHASRLEVSQGQWVNQGQVIALAGETGDATGPHLHLEIIKNGEKLNPINHLPKR
ncbi:peptidoglycan DD-metalloendopeptidase family protein [Candidatus Contubernalis alkaliaceticus]|uniref:peptidoglycan DD-metalloendopeptidase family protein n=1 Tax=Candidatus Contubernalis alkaliaceticus TaxID=338645 RepID=UPI001F4C2421|nr:M23 family metallopeptidase [Candidatus Contubernalis alkalaceticus]UNC93686.1 M23 family metallopeptidase [Candidatus Contubernalis alkalaceticus]